MKKIIALTAFALALVFVLASCAGSGSGTVNAGTTAEKNISLTEIMTKIEAAVAFSEDMYDISSAEQLADRYYFDASDVKSFAAKINGSGVECDEIVMIEAVDEDALGRIAKRLEDRLEDVCAQMKNYLPEQYEIASKCKVETRGNVATLFISKDAETIKRIFEENV